MTLVANARIPNIAKYKSAFTEHTQIAPLSLLDGAQIAMNDIAQCYYAKPSAIGGEPKTLCKIVL